MNKFDGVANTLFVPLVARINISKKFPEYFMDEKALELEKYLPQGADKGSSEYSNMASVARYYNMDKTVTAFAKSYAESNIVYLGAGLETAYDRLVTSSSYYGETSVSAYQAMKFNKDNAEKLSGMAINDTLLREMQEDCANESKDHTKSQAVTSNNQIAIDIGVGSDDTESSVLKKYFPIYSYVQQITDDDSLTLSIPYKEVPLHYLII